MSNKVCVIVNYYENTIVLEDTAYTDTQKPGREFVASAMYGSWGNRMFNFYEVLRSLIEERGYKITSRLGDVSLLCDYEKVYRINCDKGSIECVKSIEGGYILYKDGNSVIV